MDPLQIITLFLFLHLLSTVPSSSATTPMNCTDTGRICTSFLAFKPTSSITLPLIQSMFDVLIDDITVENRDLSYVFVRKNCSCDTRLRNYLTATTFTVREFDGGGGWYVYNLVGEAYDGLAYLPNWVNSSRKARVGEVVGVKLFCGCSIGLWNYLMSYVLSDGDSVASLASRFGVSMDSIEQVNGIADPDNFSVGSLYYIPLNSVPGERYPVVNSSPPAPAPILSTTPIEAVEPEHRVHVPYGWTLTIVGVCLGLVVAVVVLCVWFRSSVCCSNALRSHAKGPDGRNNHKFQILWSPSPCCTSGRDLICCRSSDRMQPNGETSNDQINNIPKVIGPDVFEMEKPVVFTYEEILSATEGFSETGLLGHGTYGSVYYGLLRDQEVAIKRMAAAKSKEFTFEMKVLCTVHHANLVELIGYATSSDELFLVYEYAQKGSLRSHLHDPQNRGQTSLSWITRVQIALDAARGLEYIHEHTKNHYVHRDIKTSNILLDSAFRAKISDFGLSKLVGKASDAAVSATRVVGTYGYLAPEYLSEGLATTKSDVYAFGVVLFELISGREAVIRTEGLTKNSERRSLVPIMLAALRNVPDSMSMVNMKDYVDPNLMDLYPHDCVFKMAMLAKQCVDEDPILRPDMKQLVISLSQTLLSSVEWEATLAGNSQVFSGLVQGR